MKLRFPLYLQTLSWLGLYLAALLVVVLVAFDSQFGVGWEAVLRSPLGNRVDTVADSVHGALTSSPASNWSQVLKQFGDIYHVKYSLYDLSGQPLTNDAAILPKAVKDRLSLLSKLHSQIAWRNLPPHPTHAHGRFLIRTNHPDCFWIGTRLNLMSTAMQHPTTAVLIASSDNLWQSSLLLDTGLIGTAAAIVLVFTVLFWYPFIYRITHRLSQLTIATEHIAEGRFDTRLSDHNGDEIGRLSEAVNRMAEQLSSFVSGQKRFLGDISHELFSPIARLQVALELLGESTSPEHQALITDIREEAEEMNSLLHELIAFSKSGIKGKGPELKPISLKELVGSLLARLDTQSQVVVDIPSALCVYADQFMLERSISNVVRNSLRYAASYGPINIKALYDNNQVLIVIADSGPGIAEEALKLIGEPFFRPEPSRNRNSGGVGLGLAIVKSCVEACGGTVSVQNRRPMGLEIEIRLQVCPS